MVFREATMEEASVYWEEQQVSSAYMDEFSPANACLKGHRRSLVVETAAGGSICLPCFAALVSDPRSPTHHVSYALSQLNLAFDDTDLLLQLRERHAYILVTPLVAALTLFEDEPIARQVIDLISDICFRGEMGRLGLGGVTERFATTSLSGDFIARIADRLASEALAWSRRHIYLLHCFGELLNSHHGSSPAAHIREKDALFSNLLVGLQLPSEELRGEVLFVIYKLCSLNITPWEAIDDDDDECVESLDAKAAALLRLALEILLKTQHDEVRMNCLALLLVLVGKGLFQNLFVNNLLGIDLKEAREDGSGIMQQSPLITLFADAVKGSLLSSEEEIQINTLNLILHMISPENCSIKQLRFLVEENIPDYIFEILRLSGNKDPVVISCLQVLALFVASEEVFIQKFVVGFSTLLSALHYTSQIPLHPVQPQALTLVCNCISNSPGIMSISQVTEVALILTCILRRCINGEPPDTFILACSTFVELLKSPSSYGIQKIGVMIKEASRSAVLSSLSFSKGNPAALVMHSLSLLKEAHIYSLREDANGSSDKELEENIIVTCQNYLLPWLEKVKNDEVEEDVVQEVLQTFHLILLSGSEVLTQRFANKLISSYWFTLCFTYLGLFPSDQMRSNVYLILGSLIDRAFGPNFGQPMRDAFLFLPADPLDLIFLLGQKSSIEPQLALCQRATLLLLYVSSLSGERFADDTQILASLEQYILVNSNDLFAGDSLMLAQVVHLYGLIRGSQKDEKMSYSPEAEKTLLNLLAKVEFELFSFDIHPMSLKWLFQQEGIMTYLANQILKFCRLSKANESHLIVYSYGSQTMSMQLISELVASGDNLVASLLVSLLRELQEEGGEDDMICVLNTIAGIMKKFSDASIQFCKHSFAGAIRAIYYSPCCSPQLFSSCSLMVFHVLYNANHNLLSQEGEWLAITMKLLEFVNPQLASQLWGQEELLVISIFCLILHYSRNQVLEEASKAILLNATLASAVENTVQTSIAKGPALVDHDEQMVTGQCLTFVLLLYFFSLNSFYATSQERLDWQDLLQSTNNAPAPLLLLISIKCHDLCRLMYIGSSLVKSLSSQCLMDILSRISDQRERNHEELRCSMRYLQSMIAIMESLVFYEEKVVATNCSICLSTILSWESLGFGEKLVIRSCKWFRMIMEEFTMTLTAPSMASKYFKNQHKPASHIAIALLSLDQTPEWMRSVFDISCISGIANNLCAQNLSAEMVHLFRALLSRKFLNEDHIGCLNQVFQICRKQAYKKSSRDKAHESLAKNFNPSNADFGDTCNLLIHLMASPVYRGKETDQQRLLREIDLFYRELSAQHE